uniref:C-type lectin domain-containing protein n=1 Tax=Oryzias sinensis TaxID=183150 RepID=A0A8C7YG91_9TELE
TEGEAAPHCRFFLPSLGILSTFLLAGTNQNLFHVCPNMSAECPWCQKSWIQFQRKCYFFSGDEVPLKTWQESRQFCQNVSADLVVIHNQQELVRAETAAGQQFSTGASDCRSRSED